MKEYKIQITDKALSEMEEIYLYIAEQLLVPEVAMSQYNRIANTIETLAIFPERVKLIELESIRLLGLRKISVDNFSIFFHIKDEEVIVTNVLYSASDIINRLKGGLSNDET